MSEPECMQWLVRHIFPACSDEEEQACMRARHLKLADVVVQATVIDDGALLVAAAADEEYE
eukprot:1651801-Amphidinium_carterae.1